MCLVNTHRGTLPLLLIYNKRGTLSMGPSEILSGILFMILGAFGYFFKRYSSKVDELENRMVKVETIMTSLLDIHKDIQQVKTDVEVIKVKLSR